MERSGLGRVLVELDYYDGPRAGIVEIEGVAHFFWTDDYLASPDDLVLQTWPVDAEALAMELEAWQIYVEWNRLYETGAVGEDTHQQTKVRTSGTPSWKNG